MQALPSYTASGKKFFSALPLSVSQAEEIASTPPWSAHPVTPAMPEPAEAGWHPQAPPEGIADGIGLAHDAGNLLGAIRLYCDLLALPGVLRSEHRHYAEELRRLSLRSGSMIERLLRPPIKAEIGGRQTYGSAAEGASAEQDQATVKLEEVLRECRGLLGTLASDGPLLVSVEGGVDTSVAVARDMVERILMNLTKNAVEAGRGIEGQGAITVRLRAIRNWKPGGAGGVALSVEDCGRGMTDAMVRALLAGEGRNASGLVPHRPGRGIGLRVVRELVQGTGGELRIRSRLGRGTTVEIVWAAKETGAAEPG